MPAASPRRELPAVIVSGPEPLLVRRAADRATDQARDVLPDRAVRVIDCTRRNDTGEPLAVEIAQAGAPSLFGDAPILRVENLEAADDAVQTVLKDLLADPGGPALVVTHNGAARGRGVLTAAGKSGAEVVKVSRPNDREIRRLASAEARAHGGQLSGPAEQWLVEALGTDSVDLLLAAVRQAVTDTPDGRVSEDTVAAMFPQQAKVSSFAVVDHVWAGRTTEALRLLRGMEQRERAVAVSVVAALAYGLRMMALAGVRGATAPPGFTVAPWQADRARDNASRWGATSSKIAAVTRVLPDLDAAMKGGLDGGIALDDEQKMAVLEEVITRLAAAAGRP